MANMDWSAFDFVVSAVNVRPLVCLYICLSKLANLCINHNNTDRMHAERYKVL